MDVIALAQNGVGNAVATLGTATTATHVNKLLRQVNRIVFCFDGDNAGRKATWRALENALEALADNKRLAFVFLPQEDNPDSYIRAHGKAEFDRLVAQAMPLSDFLLRELAQRCDLTSSEGKAQLIYEAKPLLLRLPRRCCVCNWSSGWPKPAASPRARSSACAIDCLLVWESLSNFRSQDNDIRGFFHALCVLAPHKAAGKIRTLILRS